MLLYFCIGSPSTNPRSQRYRLQFDVKPLPEIERIVVAEVRFVMSYNAPLQHDESIKVIVHDIVKPGQKGITKPILRYLLGNTNTSCFFLWFILKK